MYFLFLITINSKFYQSLGLCVVPQCLICLSLLQHLPWQRRREQTQSHVLVLLDPSAKWKSRLVSCRWLTWSSRDARHGRPLIASRSSWGELFCRQPLIIHPGFPPTWLCLVEQQNHFHSFSDCSIFSWLLSSSPRDCFLSNVRVMLKQEKQDFRLMWIQQIAPLPALNLCPVVCLTDAL